LKLTTGLVLSVVKFAGVGLVAGLLSGLFGIGGGVVMVPMMSQLLGMDQHTAQGTSLAAMVLTAVAGTIKYAMHQHVQWGPALGIAAGAVVGAAFIGADLAHHVRDSHLAKLFGVLMVLVGLQMLGAYGAAWHALGFGHGAPTQ